MLGRSLQHSLQHSLQQHSTAFGLSLRVTRTTRTSTPNTRGANGVGTAEEEEEEGKEEEEEEEVARNRPALLSVALAWWSLNTRSLVLAWRCNGHSSFTSSVGGVTGTRPSHRPLAV